MSKKFGIDVGGTSVKIGYFEGDILISKFTVQTSKQNNGADIIKDVAEAIITFASENNIDLDNIDGYGFGVPGPIVDNIVSFCPNIGWVEYDVKKEFNKYITSNNVLLANDADVAAAGEFWALKDENYRNLVFYTFGTGVGGGIIIDKKLIQGAHGGAGELGHMPVKFENAAECGCGSKGCLETVASATGIVNEAKTMLKESNTDSELREKENFTAKDVFDAAKVGDEIATNVVEQMCKYVAIASANVAATVDPDVFILGGGVAAAGDILIDTVKKYYTQYVMKQFKETPFKLAKLGNDAGIYGAAYLITK